MHIFQQNMAFLPHIGLLKSKIKQKMTPVNFYLLALFMFLPLKISSHFFRCFCRAHWLFTSFIKFSLLSLSLVIDQWENLAFQLLVHLSVCLPAPACLGPLWGCENVHPVAVVPWPQALLGGRSGVVTPSCPGAAHSVTSPDWGAARRLPGGGDEKGPGPRASQLLGGGFLGGSWMRPLPVCVSVSVCVWVGVLEMLWVRGGWVLISAGRVRCLLQQPWLGVPRPLEEPPAFLPGPEPGDQGLRALPLLGFPPGTLDLAPLLSLGF